MIIIGSVDAMVEYQIHAEDLGSNLDMDNIFFRTFFSKIKGVNMWTCPIFGTFSLRHDNFQKDKDKKGALQPGLESCCWRFEVKKARNIHYPFKIPTFQIVAGYEQ